MGGPLGQWLWVIKVLRWLAAVERMHGHRKIAFRLVEHPVDQTVMSRKPGTPDRIKPKLLWRILEDTPQGTFGV